jgi:autophagy-related protein 2
MPKRLIQYALSKFDILDTEALGLDNLDIAWGKNTTLEFRDVALRLKVFGISASNISC